MTVALNCAELSGVFTAEVSLEYGRAEVLKKIESLQLEQKELQAALKKESQFSQKVDLNMQLKKIRKEIEEQKLSLRG